MIKNLPAILKGIDALVKRIGRLLEVLNGWSNGIGNIFQSFGVDLDKTQETLNSAKFQESQDQDSVFYVALIKEYFRA